MSYDDYENYDWDNLDEDGNPALIVKEEENENTEIVKDAVGNVLQNGDSVFLIKDLKPKGSSSGLKQGTVFTNVRLVGGHEGVECKSGKSVFRIRADLIKKK